MTDFQIIHGDCRTILATLPEKSVHCCVTSPPYHGLRVYEGVEPSVWGGDTYQTCDDEGERCSFWDDSQSNPCVCGAWYGLLGLEPTIEMYVEHIVEVFRKVRRVLRDDGTLWLNVGDSYANDGKWGGSTGGKHVKALHGNSGIGRQRRTTGLKPKDLIGQPWRIGFALQADGWYLRSDIIWHKPNPMPESCTDRPTKAHEYLFLLTKRANYCYDAEAVRETARYGYSPMRRESDDYAASIGGTHGSKSVAAGDGTGGRNKRTVWTIPTEANPEAHFASFPRKLVEPCVKAGTSDKGCCPECGAPWVRVVERDRQATRPARDNKQDDTGMANRDHARHVTEVKTLGWEPGCECGNAVHIPEERVTDDMAMDADMPEAVGSIIQEDQSCWCPWEPIPCTVLDPFVGSGQAGIVATQLGRKFIGIDASETYCEMARRRIANPEPEPEIKDVDGQMMLDEVKPEVHGTAAARLDV